MDDIDPILQRAYERMEELEQEIIKLKDFIGTYRSLANALKLESANTKGTNVDRSTGGISLVDRLRAEEAGGAEEPDEAPPKRVRVRDNPKPSDVVAATVEILRRNAIPMSRRDIWHVLKGRGLEVRGADPVKALGTMLWRSGKDQLVQLEGRGYWPKDKPYEAAGYYPEDDARSLFATPR